MTENKRVCIVTGTTAGIGKSAAFQLAKVGHKVIMACRNLPKAIEIANMVKEETGNTEVYAMQVELSSMKSTMAFAQEYIKTFGKLDVLINNAADFDIARKAALMTDEGNEAQFATNLLAPFMLMQTFLPLLQASADGRVLNIASQGLVVYPNIAFDFETANTGNDYNPAKTYYQTKLGLLMLSLEWKRRYATENLVVYGVRVPNVKIDLARYPNLSSIQKMAYKIKSQFSISPEEMAKTYVRLAVGEKRNGFYYNEKLQEVRCNKNAYDEKAQAKLWELCQSLIMR